MSRLLGDYPFYVYVLCLILLFIYIRFIRSFMSGNTTVEALCEAFFIFLVPFIAISVLLGIHKTKEKTNYKEMTKEERDRYIKELKERARRDKDEEIQKKLDNERLPYDYALITRAEMLIQIVKEAGLTGYLGRSVGDIKLYMSLVTRRLEHKKLVSECDYLEELLITDYRLAIMNTPTGYKLLMIHNR